MAAIFGGTATWRSSAQGQRVLQGRSQSSRPEPRNCRHRTVHTQT